MAIAFYFLQEVIAVIRLDDCEVVAETYLVKLS